MQSEASHNRNTQRTSRAPQERGPDHIHISLSLYPCKGIQQALLSSKASPVSWATASSEQSEVKGCEAQGQA